LPISSGNTRTTRALGCTRMSTTFSTVFRSGVPPYGTLGSDHLAVNRARDQLERLAADAGLTSLLAFESYEPEDFEGLLDEGLKAQQPAAKWFAPTDGLAALCALLAHLDGHPDALPQQAAVRKDLVGLADELKAAERAGVQFRFAVIT
jgi:hypothetical protein